MLNPSADREVNNNYRLSTEKARQWWASQGFESRKNIVIESDAVINDDELVEDQTVADIADKDYDNLPDVTKQEVDAQIDDEEDVEEIFDVEGEEYLQCSTCDDMFTSNEDYEFHKSIDHGEEPEDFEESEETYQLTMHPELTRESLREANNLLTETEERQLYSGYDKNGDVQSSVMPYNVPSVATGKYNDNPNEFFYSNKIFRAGSSSLRTSSLGENVNDEIKYDGFGNIDMEDGFSQGQWDELDADMDSMNKQDEKIKEWREQGLTDDEIRVKLQNGESRASEGSIECPSCEGIGYFSTTAKCERCDGKGTISDWERNDPETGEPVPVGYSWTPDGAVKNESKASEKDHDGTVWSDFYGKWVDEDVISKDRRARGFQSGESKESEVDYEEVKYEDDGVSDISVPNTEPKGEDKNKFLDDIDYTGESIDYVYPTKANETKDKSYITESEPFEEEYEEFEDSDDEMIEETIAQRKLTGYNDDSIARELHINYGVSHEEALEKVYSIEVSTNDRVAQTFFGKMYKECTESEKDELRMYSGSD